MVQGLVQASEDDVIADLVIGFVFFVGILVSCIPQHVNCWEARSTQGLSLASLNFATATNCCRLFATVLEDSSSIIVARGQLRTWAALLPTLQNAVQVFPGMPTYTIYYFVWYKQPSETELGGEDDCSISNCSTRGRALSIPESSVALCNNPSRRYRNDVFCTGATLIFVMVATSASVLALIFPQQYQRNTQIKLWGGIAASTNAIMWLPQIITTWKLQSGGVLSIIALAYAAIGDFLLGTYWVMSGEKIWVWGSLVADSTMQMMLIGMILYFRRRHRDEEEMPPSREPLLDSTVEVAEEDVEMP